MASPTVTVLVDAAELVIVPPLPDSGPTLRLWPFKSNVPPVARASPADGPPNTASLPIISVPALMRVPPVNVFALFKSSVPPPLFVSAVGVVLSAIVEPIVSGPAY